MRSSYSLFPKFLDFYFGRFIRWQLSCLLWDCINFNKFMVLLFYKASLSVGSEKTDFSVVSFYLLMHFILIDIFE
jgi:hypothetical protein